MWGALAIVWVLLHEVHCAAAQGCVCRVPCLQDTRLQHADVALLCCVATLAVQFGGKRECGAAAAAAGAGAADRPFDASELVCGECCVLAAGSSCVKHGSRYVEWKVNGAGARAEGGGVGYGDGNPSRTGQPAAMEIMCAYRRTLCGSAPDRFTG